MIATKKEAADFDNLVLISELHGSIALSWHPGRLPGCLERLRGSGDACAHLTTAATRATQSRALPDFRQSAEASSLILSQVAVEEFDHDVKGVPGLRHVGVIEESVK